MLAAALLVPPPPPPPPPLLPPHRNERPWGTAEYVKDLKKAMVAEGLATKLVLGDIPWNVPPVLAYKNDSQFMASFDAIGIHYPCTGASEKGQGNALLAAGKKLWASEDWWSEAEWGGAACWAKLFNQNFIRANLTSTISWSTIWSVYPVVDGDEGTGDTLSGDGYWGPGLMYRLCSINQYRDRLSKKLQKEEKDLPYNSDDF